MEAYHKEKVLEVLNITKTYGITRAVDGVSFEIGKGEIVGLLGPNGAGKTTIINTIIGLLKADSGLIKAFGNDFFKNRSEVLLRMGFAATYAHLPGNLRVRENLLIYAMLYGLPNVRDVVQSIIRDFNLGNFVNKKTGFLSSGEQARLVLGKAMINKPELLLLDEPTASLDPSTSEYLRSHIRNYIDEENASAIWASHDMYEVEEICDRVLFISHGKIILEGAPLELPKKYGKKNLEELFIMVAREPLSINNR